MIRTARSPVAKAPVTAQIRQLEVLATVGMILLLLFLIPPLAAGVADVGGVAARLSPIDHQLLFLLNAHRVLTTPQLIALTERPERTVDYRLSRLRSAGLVDRMRPYAASGSAPFFWWLTRSSSGG